jgi:hypothetical protein
VLREKTTGSKCPSGTVVLQSLKDALRQRLLDPGKLVLILVSFVFFLGILPRSLLILQCVIVVIDPHDAIESVCQDPIERCSQPLRFLLESVDRRSDLEIAGAAALDRQSQLAIFNHGVVALPLGDIAHLQVVFDVALEEVPTLLSDPSHDSVLRENESAPATRLPHLHRSEAFPHQRGTQIVDQLSTELMAVCAGNPIEYRQSLNKGGSQCRYANGGSNSAGAGSG